MFRPKTHSLHFLPLPSAPLGSSPLQPTSFYGSRSVTKDYSQSHSFLDRWVSSVVWCYLPFCMRKFVSCWGQWFTTLFPPQAIQHSTDHHSQEKPHAAQSLHSLQEGTPISGLRWLEQAEAFNPGSGSATAARVRISQMGSTTCEHKQSVYVKRNWSAFILDIVNPTDTGEAFWLLARRKKLFQESVLLFWF